MDKTEKQFVDFAAGLKYQDLSKAAIHAIKARFIDTIGVALAAKTAPTVKIARQMVIPVKKGPRARLFGSLEPTTPDLAAFVNSAMVRYLDMSDAYLRASTAHPSDNIPAVLAVGEAYRKSGRDLILATAISYEIQMRMCQVVPFFFDGWDQSFAAAPAAALASARLLGLSKDRMRDALAIAAISNLATRQTRSGSLSMWKGMAGPNAAKQGIFAALMAGKGMTGPEDCFEGTFGVWNVTLGKRYRVPIPKGYKNHVFGVQQTNIKLIPMRDAVQVPVMTALDLREQIDPRSIKSLRIDSYRHAYKIQMKDAGFWAPKTRESADHSLPFGLAAALLDGKITPQTFKRRRFLDKDICALMKKMSLKFDSSFDKVAPATRSCRLTATLNDGRKVVAERRQTAKDIERGLSDEQFEAKFHELTKRVIPEKTRKKLISRLWNLDQTKDVSEIISLTKS